MLAECFERIKSVLPGYRIFSVTDLFHEIKIHFKLCLFYDMSIDGLLLLYSSRPSKMSFWNTSPTCH